LNDAGLKGLVDWKISESFENDAAARAYPEAAFPDIASSVSKEYVRL